MKMIAIVLAAASMTTAGVAVAQTQWNSGAFWRGAPDNPYQRIQFLQDRVNHGMAAAALIGARRGGLNG